VAGSGTMLVPTAFETATRLLDGRVLIAGGSQAGATAEIFSIGGSDTAGNFAFMTKLGAVGSCTDGLAPTCVAMSQPRNTHTATMIEGSRTWLNGSVVIAGGVDPPGHSTEIFVPAYPCAGDVPVTAAGAAVVGADFCDRGRTRQTLTDPSAPVPLAP
jgi:hypothetical protein